MPDRETIKLENGWYDLLKIYNFSEIQIPKALYPSGEIFYALELYHVKFLKSKDYKLLSIKFVLIESLME